MYMMSVVLPEQRIAYWSNKPTVGSNNRNDNLFPQDAPRSPMKRPTKTVQYIENLKKPGEVVVLSRIMGPEADAGPRLVRIIN